MSCGISGTGERHRGPSTTQGTKAEEAVEAFLHPHGMRLGRWEMPAVIYSAKTNRLKADLTTDDWLDRWVVIVFKGRVVRDCEPYRGMKFINLTMMAWDWVDY